MRKTQLARKTPLRRKTALKTKSQLARKTPLKKSPIGNKTGSKERAKSQREAPRGLQGIGRNRSEAEFHAKVVELGCIACEKLGMRTLFPVRIHHANGRKQHTVDDYSEWKVLPLCDQHHNPQLAFSVNGLKPDLDAPSVHCRHRLFKELVGDQESLVLEVYDKLSMVPPWATSAANV